MISSQLEDEEEIPRVLSLEEALVKVTGPSHKGGDSGLLITGWTSLLSSQEKISPSNSIFHKW